jgi:hypothetical protein
MYHLRYTLSSLVQSTICQIVGRLMSQHLPTNSWFLSFGSCAQQHHCTRSNSKRSYQKLALKVKLLDYEPSPNYDIVVDEPLTELTLGFHLGNRVIHKVTLSFTPYLLCFRPLYPFSLVSAK